MHVDVENELREAMSDTVKEEGKRDIVLFVLSSPVHPLLSTLTAASPVLTLLVSVSDI